MTVVVAYMPGTFGDAAIAAGIAESMRGDDALVVVNATKGDAYVDKSYASEADIATLEQTLATSGVEASVHRAVVPDVADEVIRVATTQSARMIIVGVRHRSPVGKALLGSVSQQIILDAPMPVLAVKPPA